jgi:site-specific DNA-methyltransferase (adenine-specific)
MSNATLQTLDLSLITAHPDNPRIAIRQDVVDGIAANLNGTFPPEHAITVRPFGDGYQILSGHHRVEAAKAHGLKEVPAWVKTLDDEAAFMVLATSNSQGELSPLEIGMHALKAVPKSEGGRGKKGGLSEYARMIGKDKGNLSRYRNAAEVYQNCCNDTTVLLDKTEHLAAIHSAPDHRPTDKKHDTPNPMWPVLVDLMLSRSWTVADCKHWVGKLAEFEFSKRWSYPSDQELAGVFLEPVAVMTRFLKSKEFSPRTVASLSAQADATVTILDAAKQEGIDTTEHEAAFIAWLEAHTEGDSWDVRKIEAYRRKLESELEALRKTTEAEAAAAEELFCLGDWREHITKVEDGSVSLLLTDPPYGIGYQSDHRLDRQQPRKHAPIAGDQSTDAIKELAVAVMPKLKDNAHVLMFCHWKNEQEIRDILTAAGLTIRGSLIWAKNNAGMGDPKTTFAPKHERIIHAVKGSPTLFDREADVLNFDRCNSERHPTEKPVDLLARLIKVTTVTGELVIDPFAGVASTLVAARDEDRKYWGCEIHEAYHTLGAERLA